MRVRFDDVGANCAGCAVTAAVSRARLDRSGAIVSADPAIAALQRRAGGQDDGPLAVPQLVRLALLAMRLGQPITRPVLVGAEHADITLWVQITPDADGANLVVTDWVETPAAPPAAPPSVLDRPLLAPSLQDGWRWQCDAQLRLTGLSAPSNQTALSRDLWLGRSLSQVFVLQADADGQFPILIALASQRGFMGQRAQLQGVPTGHIRAGDGGSAADRGRGICWFFRHGRSMVGRNGTIGRRRGPGVSGAAAR